MKNKGFSLVELIIVIAIMAILAAAIAPALIRYIDKSRKADHVAAAETVNTAVNAALANEDAYSEVANNMNGNAFATANAGVAFTATGVTAPTFLSEVNSSVGGSAPKVKYSKDHNTTWKIGISTNGKAVIWKGNVELQPDIHPSYK